MTDIRQTSAKGSFETIITVTLNTAIDRVLEVPNFTLGRHQTGRCLTLQPAGKGLNVSRSLAVLGVPSIATGFAGEGELAEFDLPAHTPLLNPQFLSVRGRTRENVTILDPESETETHIRTSGFEVAPGDLDRLKKKLHLLAKPSTVVVFAGSRPAGMSAADAERLVDLALAGGAHVVIDSDEDVLERVAGKSLWLLKPNRAEFDRIAPQAAESEESLIAAGRALSGHIRTVIVTCGGAGSYAFIDGAAFMGQVALDGEHVVSSVGCGDAMLAGFIAAQVRGRNVRDSYAYGSAVATAAAVSAAPGTFRLEDVEKFEGRTSVLPIEDSGRA